MLGLVTKWAGLGQAWTWLYSAQEHPTYILSKREIKAYLDHIYLRFEILIVYTVTNIGNI